MSVQSAQLNSTHSLHQPEITQNFNFDRNSGLPNNWSQVLCCRNGVLDVIDHGIYIRILNPRDENSGIEIVDSSTPNAHYVKLNDTRDGPEMWCGFSALEEQYLLRVFAKANEIIKNTIHGLPVLETQQSEKPGYDSGIRGNLSNLLNALSPSEFEIPDEVFTEDSFEQILGDSVFSPIDIDDPKDVLGAEHPSPAKRPADQPALYPPTSESIGQKLFSLFKSLINHLTNLFSALFFFCVRRSN